LGEDYEATTLGGLVSEIVGRIPKAGEVVTLGPLGLRVEIVASTGRRVERVRLFPATARLPFPKESNVQSES
jgi:CBS domain containing-hemolysin-like protein